MCGAIIQLADYDPIECGMCPFRTTYDQIHLPVIAPYFVDALSSSPNGLNLCAGSDHEVGSEADACLGYSRRKGWCCGNLAINFEYHPETEWY